MFDGASPTASRLFQRWKVRWASVSSHNWINDSCSNLNLNRNRFNMCLLDGGWATCSRHQRASAGLISRSDPSSSLTNILCLFTDVCRSFTCLERLSFVRDFLLLLIRLSSSSVSSSVSFMRRRQCAQREVFNVPLKNSPWKWAGAAWCVCQCRFPSWHFILRWCVCYFIC